MGDGLQYPTQGQYQLPSYESMGETAPARLDSNTSDKNNTFDKHNNDANFVVNNSDTSKNFANVVVNVDNHNNIDSVEKNLLNCNNNAQSTIINNIDNASTNLKNNKNIPENDLNFIDEGFSSDEKLKNDDEDSADGSSQQWAVKSIPSRIASASDASNHNNINKNHIIDI